MCSVQVAFCPETVREVLAWIAEHPGEFLLRRWNWKAALWSGLFRAAAFAGPAWTEGKGHAAEAAAVEFVFRAAVSGASGSLTQILRHAGPRWQALLVLLVGAPTVLHLAEAGLHLLAGTPKLGSGMSFSVAMTATAVLFNLYAMRRGVLLTGEEGGSFGSDLKRMPAMVAGFVAWPFLALAQAKRKGGPGDRDRHE
jgi:hypothetical protein